MAIYEPIHRDLYARYGIPHHSGVESAWRIELDAADLQVMSGQEWPGVTVTAVGIDWQIGPSDHPKVVTASGVQLDVVRVEVTLDGGPAMLIWSWNLFDKGRLDMLHLEGLPRREILNLLKARKFADLDWSSLGGRPSGTGIFTPEGFEQALRAAVSRLRQRQGSFTKEDLVHEMRISSATTLDDYLRAAHVHWGQVRDGLWPP